MQNNVGVHAPQTPPSHTMLQDSNSLCK